MGILKNGTSVKYKILHNGSPLKKGYHNGNVEIWSAGNTVTYKVDSGVTYTEEVDYGATCLSPRTFTPTKSGWTFVGWRSDSAANSTVISSMVMGDDPITLYAVFKQVITVTYYNDSTTPTTAQANRYYNNGSVANARFSLTQDAKSGWDAVGWSTSNAANGGVTYPNGSAFTRDSNVTLYGRYNKAITLYYNNNGAPNGSVANQNGTVCYNSSGSIVGHTFTLAANGYSMSGCHFIGWNTTASATSGVAAGTTVTLTESVTYFAIWRDNNYTVYSAVVDPNQIYATTTGSINSEYVSVTAPYAEAGARVNINGDDNHDQPRGSATLGITLNYGEHFTRATITFIARRDNQADTRHGTIICYDNADWYEEIPDGWYPDYRHTMTTSATEFFINVQAEIEDDNDGLYTWQSTSVAIESIVLS